MSYFIDLSLPFGSCLLYWCPWFPQLNSGWGRIRHNFHSCTPAEEGFTITSTDKLRLGKDLPLLPQTNSGWGRILLNFQRRTPAGEGFHFTSTDELQLFFLHSTIVLTTQNPWPHRPGAIWFHSTKIICLSVILHEQFQLLRQLGCSRQ